MWKKFWRIIEKPFLMVSSLCSIVSIIAMLFNSLIATVIALVALCASFIVLLIAIVRVLNKFLEDGSSENHRCISSFITYKTDDCENIEFETFKLIQSKCSIMQFFDLGFKWSGDRFPQIESSLQDVEFTKKSEKSEDYDSVQLRLKRPVLYNETTLIHFKSKMNDSDRISIPKVEVCVRYPIEFIQVNILLGYKDKRFNRTAKVERCKIDTKLPQSYETVTSIPFENKNNQYSYSFINPEPGYFYRITWDR